MHPHGNGVANSTVFGGLAGESMAADLAAGRHGLAAFRDPDEADIRAGVARHEVPFHAPAGQPQAIDALRESLYEKMWQDVGILRTADGLRRALARLAELDGELSRCGVADGDRAFNLSWHD